MSKKMGWSFIILSLLISCAPGTMGLLKKDDLKGYTGRKIMEIAADSYGNYNYADARYYYQQILELFPDDPDLTAWAHYEIGYTYFQDQDFKNAATEFEKVMTISSKSPAPQLLAKKMIDIARKKL